MTFKKIYAVRTVLALLIIANMIMIFMFSAENGEESGSRSDGVIDFLALVFIKDYDELPEAEKIEIRLSMGRPVRKAAHMAEYASLAFLAAALIITYTDKLYLMLPIPVCFAFLYAMTDELLHQSVTAGRAGRFTDVLIDTAGAIIGTLVLWGGFALQKHIRNRKKAL